MKNIKAIFDNGGQTLDRYTVIFSDGDMLGLSIDGVAFSQFCGNCIDNYMFVSYGYSWRRHCDVKKIIKNKLPEIIEGFKNDGNLGKLVKFESLSTELKMHIKNRI